MVMIKKSEIYLKWAKFLLGICSILIFVFGIAPFLQRYEPIAAIHQYIQENDIDATPLFYTEAEEFAEADSMMADIMGSAH